VMLGTWRGLNHRAAKIANGREYRRLFESATQADMSAIGEGYPEHLRPLFNPSRPDFHVRKYTVAYPQGESCRQVNQRIEPVLLDIVRAEGPVLIVAKPTPAQGVLAYLCDVKPEHSPLLCIPRHRVLEIGNKGSLTFHDPMSVGVGYS
jgi:broad specificity phosphatase PhoE